MKKVYIGYKAYAFTRGWEVVKVFAKEMDAKKWMQEENAKIHQESDSYGFVDGEEYNYFEKDVE